MPIGSVNKEPAAKRETFRPPWVKDKDAAAPPPWTQRKLKPVDTAKTAKADKADGEEQPTPAPAAKPLKPVLKKQSTIKEKSDKPEKTQNGVSETVEEKLVKPSAAKSADKASRPADEKPRFTKSSLRSVDKSPKTEDKNSNEKAPEKPALRSVRTIDGDKTKDKSVTIVDKKPVEKNSTSKTNNTAANHKTPNDKSVTNSTSKTSETKPLLKKTDTTKVEEKDDSKMATKPPIEKPTTKLPPRKPSLVKQASKDEPVRKWRDPLHERVKENIDKTLNEVPKGHTLTKNESLRRNPAMSPRFQQSEGPRCQSFTP